jgi:hypothetical protein
MRQEPEKMDHAVAFIFRYPTNPNIPRIPLAISQKVGGSGVALTGDCDDIGAPNKSIQSADALLRMSPESCDETKRLYLSPATV